MKSILVSSLIALGFFANAQVDTFKLDTRYSALNYQIGYPSFYSLDTSRISNTAFFLFSQIENDSDKFRENINLIIQDLKGYNVTLQLYKEKTEQEINILVTDGKIFESKIVKTSDKEYYAITYSMRQGIFMLKLVAYCFIKDEKAYLLTFTAELSQFDRYKDYAIMILNSFHLTD
jgi:hypothetical protein